MFSLKSRTKLLGATVATAAGLFCCAGSGPAAQPMSQVPRPIEPTIAPAGKVTARVASTETVDESQAVSGLIEGFTEPYADINLAAAEMGILSEVLVEDGDEVKAGQLVAKMNDEVLEASLAVARSAMSATGELKSATTQFELKQVEAKKLAELFERTHASQKELDRVAGEVQIAESRVVSVQEDLAIRQLEYARIEAQINQRQIRSTIDGVVVDVRKDEGEFVSPSDPVVVRIVQLDPLLVVFSVPNNNRSHVQKNQTVSMRIAGSGIAEGIVEHVSPTADASSGTFKVKVRLPNPDRRWYGGEKSELLLNSGSYEAPKQIARTSE